MAGLADTLALDDTQMTGHATNAAIYFAADGYDPGAKGINGRRVAGESFIRGFFRHAEVPALLSFAQKRADQDLFARFAGEERPGHTVQHLPLRSPQRLAEPGTLFFPSPNFAHECWRRAPHGPASWSVCGITHTISTKGVMQGFFDLRMAPQMEWDAIICTSRAVQSAVLTQMEMIDEHARARFMANPPPRPQLPVIPLGIDCTAFAPDPAAGAGLRARLGADKGDVVFTCIARLTPYEKFDPLPFYIALAEAQRRLGARQKLHLALCGIFRDAYSRKVFEDGAARLMPDVGFLVLDGADPAERRAALSGADVFAFPIDNIQETFGLAPIEAMAAGLPVLVSDWDGMRDTVTPDVGLRVPTRTLGPGHAVSEALRHFGGADTYPQYCALASQMTAIDMRALVEAILALAGNPALRRKMGTAGKARAAGLYDWRVIVPQMQALWGELAARRRAAVALAPPPAGRLPVAPSPFVYFAEYPTAAGSFAGVRFASAAPQPPLPVAEVLALRNYAGLGRSTERPEAFATMAEAIAAAGSAGISRDELVSAHKYNPLTVDRLLIWLLKYGYIRRLPPAQSRK